MDYIIKANDNLYFGGWDPVLGKQIFTSDINLSYRMRRPLALKTLDKILPEYQQAIVIKL